MDWMKLRSYSQKRQTPKRTHCASPLPAKTASVAMVGMKSEAKASRERPVQLSNFNCDPQVKSTAGKKKGQRKRSTVTKALPKIQEHSQMVCPSSEESIELNCSEHRSMEVTNDISDVKTTPLKDSLHLASEGTQSPRYSEATSEMTLPTGVSDFLLDCLDMETIRDCSYTESIDSTSSYSSPEIFRDETGLEDTASPETHLACKNSTLLDTSKAINIDKMPQLPNLSKILGTPLGIQGQNIARKQSRQKLPSEATNTSAMVAGKQVYKILSANEKRLKSQPSGVSLLLPEQKNKTEYQQPVKRKCRKKITFEDVSSLSSPPVLPSSGQNSTKEMYGIAASKLSEADRTEYQQPVKRKCRKKVTFEDVSSLSSPPVLPSSGQNSSKEMYGIAASKLSEADRLDVLSTHEASVRDSCLAHTKSPNVNSEAIVPRSPQRTIYQYLHSPPEICCIIQASPGFRPLKVLQHPTNRKKGFIPPEATEDIITSSENWTSGNGS